MHRTCAGVWTRALMACISDFESNVRNGRPLGSGLVVHR